MSFERDEPSPRTFGRFRIVRPLGRGGSSVVFEAIDGELGRPVALKLLRSGERATHDEVERLRREGEALARVRHRNVVTVYEAGSKDGMRYVVLEPLPGPNLRDYLASRDAGQDERLRLVEEAARGVHAAHEAGVLHRDLKPANVLVDADGHARVVDFGLARLDDASFALTASGTSLGTPGYMAPEAARGDGAAISARSDVYSLGAMLHEVLAGEPPHASLSPEELLRELASSNPPPRLREKSPGVSPALEEICSRALAKDPHARFETALAFAESLAAARRGTFAPRERSRLMPVVPGLVLLVAIAGLLAFSVGRSSDDPPERDGVAASTRNDSSPSVVASATGTAHALGPPAWYVGLPESRRPTLPLPAKLRFGEAPLEYVNVVDGSVLVYVPGGSFKMGSSRIQPRDGPVHEVRLSPCFIGKLEVTNEQFASFVRATGHVTTAEAQGFGFTVGASGVTLVRGASWKDPQGTGSSPPANHPVVQVSWEDARLYAAWAGMVLPTEAQWERAASWDPGARHARSYAWGDLVPGTGSPLYANVQDEPAHEELGLPSWFPGYSDGFLRTAPVGSFPLGASPVGALDMTGNVAEWCRDGFDETFYSRSPREDPFVRSEASQFRSVRGGSWATGPQGSLAARRGKCEPGGQTDDLGFRVVFE